MTQLIPVLVLEPAHGVLVQEHFHLLVNGFVSEDHCTGEVIRATMAHFHVLWTEKMLVGTDVVRFRVGGVIHAKAPIL